MPASLRRWNLKLLAAFLFSFACLVAQDPTSLLTPGVMRVGGRLACRCGYVPEYRSRLPYAAVQLHGADACPHKATAGDGASDETVINTIVREQGVVALAAPPAEGWGLFTWMMPGLALLMGFGCIRGGCAETGGGRRPFPKLTARFSIVSRSDRRRTRRAG